MSAAFPWVQPPFVLALPRLGAGPFTLVLAADQRTLKLVNEQGKVVLVMGNTHADVFEVTGSPPGIMKGERD